MSTDTPQAKLESWLTRVWYEGEKPSLFAAFALNSLAVIYRLLRRLSGQAAKSKASKVHFSEKKPVVLVVGNLIAGGAGKTPVVMAVCKHAQHLGLQVGIVSRGYKRHTKNIQVLDPKAGEVNSQIAGDEPALLANTTGCPIAVGADRKAALQALLKFKPNLDLVVSDDGLQHHRLSRQVEWVVFDQRGQGNGKLLPAGPLREPIERLDNVDAVIANGTSTAALAQSLGMQPNRNWHEIQVRISGFSNGLGQFVAAEDAHRMWQGLRVMAFTGMANPDKLFSGLKALGLAQVHTIGLPDHFDYPAAYCAQFNHDVLITSGKDAVKLEASNPRLWVAQIQVELPTALQKSLEVCLGLTTD